MSADQTPPAEPSFQTRVFIEKDGTVVFENLSEELLELAHALNPEATIACDAGAGTILDDPGAGGAQAPPPETGGRSG